MLDASGSMSGSLWNDLYKCVCSFIDKLATSSESKESSRISVIVYDNNSRIVFKNQKPDQTLKSKISYTCGGTDFEKPLINAHSICEELGNEASEIVLYFMTDGHASYPSNAVNTILKSSYIGKVEFLGVGFGHGGGYFGGFGGQPSTSKFPVVEQIVNKFPNGKMQEAKDVGELMATFDFILRDTSADPGDSGRKAQKQGDPNW